MGNYMIKYGGVPFTTMKRTFTVKCIWINVLAMSFIAVFTIYLLSTEPNLLVLQTLAIFQYITKELPNWLIVISRIFDFYLTMAGIQSLVCIICVTKNLKDEFRQLSLDLRDRQKELNGKWPFGNINSHNVYDNIQPERKHPQISN